jgi:hypothetical protein
MNMNENIQVAFLNRLKKNGTVFHLTQLVSPMITPMHARTNQMEFIFTSSFLTKDVFQSFIAIDILFGTTSF